MGRLFGTDGVRGQANTELTAELALDLAVAAAHVLADAGEFAGHRPVAVVGRDGRASGEFLGAAVMAGLASAGVEVLDAGVLPTPAVAFLVAELGADLGVMLSASHNPMPDNGIKFFARGGVKLDDAVEDAVEARMEEPWQRPTGADVGRIRTLQGGRDRYVAHLVTSLPHRLEGLRVVVDCANGAASWTAPEALRLAGAEVVAISADPDGTNINEGCGSTHLEPLRAAVLEHGADVGIAHDGDADRCLAVDAHGGDVDGDQILAVLALGLLDRGLLTGDSVVATVMSNLGFRLAMERAGVRVVETAVGDRYVLEAMKEGGLPLGGEQSGHVVMLDHATTGDGTLTALHLLARVAETGKPLSELAAVMQRLPQVLVNVAGVDKGQVAASEALASAVVAASAELGESGRVLLRPSGTEPLVRVMVEARLEAQAKAVAAQLAGVVETELGQVGG
jgi:phosphoglucosamine mutase